MATKSKLEKTTKQFQFERGQLDVQKGFPPREGSPAYLEGYSVKFNETHELRYVKK